MIGSPKRKADAENGVRVGSGTKKVAVGAAGVAATSLTVFGLVLGGWHGRANIDPPDPPLLTAAAVNTAGTTLTLTYDETLDGASDPAGNAYVVKYNGTGQPSPTAVNAAGTTVDLTLAGLAFSGDTITLDYTPGGAPIQAADDGSDAAALSNQAVTNNSTQTQGGNVGNLWVDTNGGTCSRSGTQVAYVDAAACSSYNAAYQAANNSDLICVAASGTPYPPQPILYKSAITSMVTIDGDCAGTSRTAVTAVNVTIGNGSGGFQPRHITVKDMSITGRVSGTLSNERAVNIYNGGTVTAQNPGDLIFTNLNIAVGQAALSPVFESIAAVQGMTISYSTIGPACCGNTAGGATAGSPVGIRIGTADRVSNGWPNNINIVIDHVLVQGITRWAPHWLSGYGSAPQSSCINTGDQCHADAIQIYGADGLTVTNNKLYHNEVQGLFLDPTDPFDGPGLIANNMIGDVTDDMVSSQGSIAAISMSGTLLSGTWNIFNNTLGDDGALGIVWAGQANANTVLNVKGNIGNWTMTDGNSGTDCDGVDVTNNGGGSPVPDFPGTLSLDRNNWMGNSGVTGCGGNETTGSVGFVNTATAPNNTMDLHLGSGTNADNRVPTCPVATDIDGQARGNPCEAGADER